MLERNRLGGKRRNVSETTLSSPSGEFGSDNTEPGFYYKRQSKMDQYSDSSSESDGDETYEVTKGRTSKKPNSFSKNAILARRNRIKKKKYLEDLENEVKSLRAENAALRVNVDGYSKDMEVVRKENRYLRNVLASSREISRLLGVIQDKSGLLTTSSVHKQDKIPEDQSQECKQDNDALKVITRPAQPNLPVQKVLPFLPSSDPELLLDDSLLTLDDVPLSSINSDVSLSDLQCSDDPPSPLKLFDSNDHDYLDFDPDVPVDWLGGEEELSNIGVCLHVAKKKVSLEFCQFCNENASRSFEASC